MGGGFEEFGELVLGEVGDAVGGEIAGIVVGDCGEKESKGVWSHWERCGGVMGMIVAFGWGSCACFSFGVG